MYEELEEYVKDYILEGNRDDPMLNEYITLVLEADTRQIEIFSEGLLDRPAFFERYMRRWILDGYQELAATQQLQPTLAQVS